jgi:hypothetical protein
MDYPRSAEDKIASDEAWFLLCIIVVYFGKEPNRIDYHGKVSQSNGSYPVI